MGVGNPGFQAAVEQIVLAEHRAEGIGVDHFFHHLDLVVERKGQVADHFPVERLGGFVKQLEFEHPVFEEIGVDAVEVVEIDAVGLQLGQLFLQEAEKIVAGVDAPQRELARKHNPAPPIALGEGEADRALAVAPAVAVSGIDIIDPLLEAVDQQLRGFLKRGNDALGGAGDRQPHGAESQAGNLDPGFSEVGV